MNGGYLRVGTNSSSLAFSERIWIKFKSYHKFNKIFSVLLSLVLAYWTLSYKHLAYEYYKHSVRKGEYPRHANVYNFVLWLSFVYYACSALAESMELYSSVLGRDRGALGLLFEMNQLMGIIIAFWIAYWAHTGGYKVRDEEFIALERFVRI